MSVHPSGARALPQFATVRSLVEDLAEGRIRVPNFQREFQWDAEDVAALLDSVFKNYPIGTILLWQTPQPAATYTLGPVQVRAHAQEDCLMVVDGQQRLLSLLGALRHEYSSLEEAPKEHRKFFLVHDLEKGVFLTGKDAKAKGTRFVPVNMLGDPNILLRWCAEHLEGQQALVGRAFDASNRLRDYQLPYWELRNATQANVKEVFSRLNTHGRELKWEDLFEGLVERGDTGLKQLEAIGAELTSLGFGGVPDRVILMAVLSCMGWDLTRNIRQSVERAAKDGAVQATLPALRSAAVFFLNAGLPGFQAVTFLHLFACVSRFFHLHPAPHPRNLVLLRRFVWRGLVSGAFGGDSRPVTRRLHACVTKDQDESVQALLGAVPKQPPQLALTALDSRSATARLFFVALRMLGPRDWTTGQVRRVEMPAQLSSLGKLVTGATGENARTMANRLLVTPAQGDALQAAASGLVPSDEVLESHLLDQDMWKRLVNGDTEGVLDERRRRLTSELGTLVAARAEWDLNDNPPLKVTRKAG